MRHALPLAVLGLFSLTGCNGDDMMDVDSSLACDCSDFTAADIAYDNVGSGLSGTDVQDAVDELAARPAVTDAYLRTELVEEMQVAPDSQSSFAVAAVCPSSAPNRAIALGGSCGIAPNADLTATDLQEHGFTCVWSYPMGEAPTLTAKVRCLAPADDQ